MKNRMIAAALAVCACASDPHAEMRADAKQVDAFAHELAQEAQGYCAAAPWTAPAACTDALSAHRESVAGRLASLMQSADRMDGYLRDVGSDALADTACGLPAVQAEMDRYDEVYGAADPATAEAEALEHCAALIDAAAQLHARANAVLRATGHRVRIGGSGSMPGHLQQLPTGEHAWPWAAEAEPAAVPMCAG